MTVRLDTAVTGYGPEIEGRGAAVTMLLFALAEIVFELFGGEFVGIGYEFGCAGYGLTMGAEERIAGSDGAALYTVDSVVSVVSHSIYKSSADRLKQAAQLASSYLQNACYKLYDNRHNPQREKHAAAPQPAAVIPRHLRTP